MKTCGSFCVIQCVTRSEKRGREEAGVVGEPLRGVAVQPAAAAVEGEGEVPVEAGEPRLDAGLQQLVDEPVVEVEPPRVRRARAVRAARAASSR